MGILGKDLFDIDRPRTHVKVQFGQSAYWVEHDPAPHPYGETLTELLNYDVTPYEHTLSALKQAMEEKDAQAAPRGGICPLSLIFACSCLTCGSSTNCPWSVL